MSSYPSLPLFTDAFIADTGHLTAQETGAYLMLLMMAWRAADCRLPDDDDKLARWARVDRRTWLRIKPKVMEFWALADGFWSQKRLSKERDIVSKRADAARLNGKQGGRPKSLRNNETENPAGSTSLTQRKAPNPNPIESPKAPKGGEPEGFAEFWLTYPKRRGDNPRKTALPAYVAALRRGATHSAIMTALRRYVAELTEDSKIGTQFVALAATWLNQDRFERPADDAAAPPAGQELGEGDYLSRLSDEQWRDHVSRWQATRGQWLLAQRTHPPDDRRTRVPTAILAEFGIRPGEIGFGTRPMQGTG